MFTIRVPLLFGSLLLVSAVMAQQPSGGYSFKGNTLGMTLEEFKKANDKGMVTLTTQPGGKAPSQNPRLFEKRPKATSTQVPTPLCTDTAHGFAGDPTGHVGVQPLGEGEVLCNPVRSFDDLKIGEQSAGSITYTFYKDRLYKIQITVVSSAFAAVRSAFDDRYGAEKQVTQTEYGNALGARWKGSNVQWVNGAQSITMVEGLGNGPGQVGFSGILFLDPTLQPPVNTPAANF